MSKRPPWCLLLPLLASTPLSAQSIALKTVPIATGEQFLVFPSRSLAMGGLSVAYDDPLGDPFANPARGSRVHGAWLVSSPTTYDGGTAQRVSGHTLPLSVAWGGERWFGTASVALQQVATPMPQQTWWWTPLENDRLLQDDAATNGYLAGSLGRRFEDGRLAVGVSGSRADLKAIDGVGQLYANSFSIAQTGTITELRLGAVKELDGERRLEGMVGRSEVDMRHDVGYVQWLAWDPVTPGGPQTSVRTEENLDRTITWSGSVRYTAPAGDPRTRWGVLVIGNTKSHPKIPNYDVVNIPRDPGNSAVFGLGAGVTSRRGGTLWGAEVLLQPGHSHTWAFADSAVAVPGGGILDPGDKTVDNRFDFANGSLALGMDHQWRPGGVQVGIRVDRYAYHLDQENYLRATSVETDEDWLEWSPSWGANLKLGGTELRYTGRFVAKGFDQQRNVWRGPMPAWAELALPMGDFLVAPTDPVDMADFRVVTHRLTVVVPLAGER